MVNFKYLNLNHIILLPLSKTLRITTVVPIPLSGTVLPRNDSLFFCLFHVFTQSVHGNDKIEELCAKAVNVTVISK